MTDHKKWEREMSSGFGGMMDGIRAEPMPEESLQRSLEAAEAIMMTKAAYKRGQKNAGVVMLMMYPIVGLIAFWISKQFNASPILSTGGLFCGLFALLFPFVIANMLLGKAHAGNVILDCGPHPTRKLFLVMAAVMLIGAVATVIASTETTAILFAIFLTGFAMYWLLMSTGRLLICENGVFQYWGLLRWNKIRSYRWEGDTDATLMVRTTARFALLGRGAFPVAIEQKDAVDALLREHAPGKRQSTD